MAIFRRSKSQDAAALIAAVTTTAAPAAHPAGPAPGPAPTAGLPDLPAARFAPVEEDAVLHGLIDSAKARDWATIRNTLSGYSGQDFTSLAANLCKYAPELDDWLPDAVGDGAGDALARLVFGARLVDRGWKIRTADRATNVSKEQFAAFHEHLREAEEYFYDSAELDRTSPAPWYHLLISGRGLQVGLPVIRRRFEAVTGRCPNHAAAHRQMLQSLCRKWSGTNEQMRAFALEAMRGPYGLQLGELVALAHIEFWLDLDKEERRAHMTSTPVRDELLEAADRSIFDPEFTASPRSPHYSCNAFAMALALAGLYPQARAAFAATEGVVTEFPWSYLNGKDQAAAYTKWRDVSYQAAA